MRINLCGECKNEVESLDDKQSSPDIGSLIYKACETSYQSIVMWVRKNNNSSNCTI
jgi:hypothetical protein